MPSDCNAELVRVQNKVHGIWLRARSNAFAHREAADEYRLKNSNYFLYQVIFGILSIILVLLAYVSSSGEIKRLFFLFEFLFSLFEFLFSLFKLLFFLHLPKSLFYLKSLFSLDEFEASLPLIFTLFSVFTGSASLFKGIMQNHYEYGLKYMIHDHNQHSYLFIAQRAREVEWPGINTTKAIAILEDLERDFQVLKVRGPEPNDNQFRKANKLLERLRKGKEQEMQSFGGVQSD